MSKPKKTPLVEQTTHTANGVIRRGQRAVFKKSTQEEMEQRISEVADYIAANPFIHDGELKDWIKKAYHIKWWQAWNYINKARKLIVKRSNIDAPQAKDMVVNYLFNVMRTGNRNEGLRAADQLRGIYGLDVKHVRVSDPNGNPVAPTVVAPSVTFIIPDNHREKNGNS